MGNNESETKTNQFLNQYQEIRRENGGMVIEHKESQIHYLLKEFSFADKQQYQKHLQRLKNQGENPSNDNLLNIHHLESKQFHNFCSNTYKIYGIYQYPLITLQEEIHARKTQNKYFEECELWAILHSCVNALEEINPAIGLHPTIIFIVADGMVKLLNNDLILEDHRCIVNEDIYYAPEKITDFHRADSEQKLKKQVSFSLGMTMLHTALLEPVNNCYNYDNFEFSETILEQHLEKLVNQYSQQFIETLTMMLEPVPDKRSSICEIKSLMNEVWDAEVSQNNKESSGIPKLQNQGAQFLRDTYVNSYAMTFNQSKKPSKPTLNEPSIQELNKQNLFTDPKLLQMIRNDLKAISIHKEHQRSSISSFQPSVRFSDPKYNQTIEKQSLISPIDQTVLSSLGNSIMKGNDFKKVKQQGFFVIENYEDGRKYEGIIINGIRNGPGKLTYSDGAYYQGDFKDGLMNGQGRLFYGEGKVAYEGDWVADQFQGFGILYNECPIRLNGQYNYDDFDVVDDFWLRYEGQFRNDCKEGKGKFYLSNGQVFEGQFHNDALNGKGVFTTLANERIEGIWQNNILAELIQ